MGRVYHVALTGNDCANGDKEHPFRTIQKAAELVSAYDVVIVHEGTYREWVNPLNTGLSDTARIIFKAADHEKVVIKGSEIINTWENVEGSVFKVTILNEFFKDYNPYATAVCGDWFIKPEEYKVHTGDVYVNGKSFYEVSSLEEVKNPKIRKFGCDIGWANRKEEISHPEDTIYVWYAEVSEKETTIYANFHEYDPNKEVTEINVRKCCFYPKKTGRNYITVKGFEMAHAATLWAPPTAEQVGLLGAHWSKGWIIENNIIHDSKCCGISIGKEESTGQNFFSTNHRKPGYQNQMEAVFKALKIGWSKENIGSHIIRNNKIYDCGQAGIVGHLGCIYSEIYNNDIFRIAMKHEYFGFEIAGIKLHTAIDVTIRHNRIHECTLGTWLDWEAQGARVSQNLFYNNERDMMIEVTHGPHTIDHNIFGSSYNLQNVAQGGAYIHNLFCGSMKRCCSMNRSTPYHLPHSTDVAGSIITYGADDRYYQNIFFGGHTSEEDKFFSGTASYNGCPASYEKYLELLSKAGQGDENLYEMVKQPAYINGNCYLNDACSYEQEINKEEGGCNADVRIWDQENETYLEITIPQNISLNGVTLVTTELLGLTRCSDGQFENPDGSPIVFERDYFDCLRNSHPTIGPIEKLRSGKNIFRVW